MEIFAKSELDEESNSPREPLDGATIKYTRVTQIFKADFLENGVLYKKISLHIFGSIFHAQSTLTLFFPPQTENTRFSSSRDDGRNKGNNRKSDPKREQGLKLKLLHPKHRSWGANEASSRDDHSSSSAA